MTAHHTVSLEQRVHVFRSGGSRGRRPGLARSRISDDGADRCDRDRAGDEPRPGAGLELTDLGSTPHSGEKHFVRQTVSG